MIVVRSIPVYWGVETDAVDTSLITRSTLHEVLPPYRRSLWAFRIRVSPWHWLHVGRYEFERGVGRYGLDATPDEIAEWRGPRVAEEDANGTAAEPESV